MIFVWLGLAALTLRVMFVVGRNLRFKAVHGFKRKSLSTASWEIIREYKALPEDNRPFANIYLLLHALDVKHDIDQVKYHFRRHYDHSSFTWECDCKRWHRKCSYREYIDLHVAIEEVRLALEKQQHALQMAAVAYHFDAIKELTDRLRDEKNLINTVTRELT